METRHHNKNGAPPKSQTSSTKYNFNKMDNQNSSNAEVKAKIKSHFVDINEDKFTKVKVVKCKPTFKWKDSALENKFMITEKAYSHNLELKLDYRHKEETDSVFFVFNYYNTDDGYAHMNNLQLFLILDDNKTIKLNNVSGLDSYSKMSKAGDKYFNFYIEIGHLSISVSDFIQIANANKIDYSIRFGSGQLDGTFSDNELNIFKGFYNATFDEDFEVYRLSKYLNTEPSKPKEVKGGGGCYIATMAYGRYEHPQVMVLRDFRDNYLAKRNWGTKFIATYYKYSPKLVKHLKNKVFINRIVRNILNLFIKIIK